eukprot:COSAG01_NODE_64862_length_275_cov_0.585227_1_plen_37_part_01
MAAECARRPFYTDTPAVVPFMSATLDSLWRPVADKVS